MIWQFLGLLLRYFVECPLLGFFLSFSHIRIDIVSWVVFGLALTITLEFVAYRQVS